MTVDDDFIKECEDIMTQTEDVIDPIISKQKGEKLEKVKRVIKETKAMLEYDKLKEQVGEENIERVELDNTKTIRRYNSNLDAMVKFVNLVMKFAEGVSPIKIDGFASDWESCEETQKALRECLMEEFDDILTEMTPSMRLLMFTTGHLSNAIAGKAKLKQITISDDQFNNLTNPVVPPGTDATVQVRELTPTIRPVISPYTNIYGKGY